MIIKFNGWGKDHGPHQFFAIPVTKTNDGYIPGEMLDPIVWHDSIRAFAKIICMKLEGDYLVEFIFDDKELKNWLLQYVKAEPEAAIKLVSEAILALSPMTQEEKSSLGD